MVDLVKIRKKAKKDREEALTAPSVIGSGSDAPLSPASEKPLSLPPVETPPPLEIATAPALPISSKLEKFKETAGKRRDAVAAEQVAAGSVAALELLTFMLSGEQYAVDIERIMEIVTPRPVTRIPNADSSVVGIVSLRGTIVTLVDVRAKLRHPPSTTIDPETRIVVVDLGSEMLGFTVDRVLRVVKTAPEAVEPHPVVHVSEQDAAIRGVFRTGDALTILLDLDKLLAGRVPLAS